MLLICGMYVNCQSVTVMPDSKYRHLDKKWLRSPDLINFTPRPFCHVPLCLWTKNHKVSAAGKYWRCEVLVSYFRAIHLSVRCVWAAEVCVAGDPSLERIGSYRAYFTVQQHHLGRGSQTCNWGFPWCLYIPSDSSPRLLHHQLWKHPWERWYFSLYLCGTFIVAASCV